MRYWPILLCILLSACGGGSGYGTGANTGLGGSASNQSTFTNGPITCTTGCTMTTPSGIQIQVQMTSGTNCSLSLTASNSNSAVGLPALGNAAVYLSYGVNDLTAPCNGGNFVFTQTFTSANGATFNWSSASADLLNGASSTWSATSFSAAAASLTINSFTMPALVTAGFATTGNMQNFAIVVQ